MSNGSKHTSQSLFNTSFTVLTWKLQVVHGRSTCQTTALLFEMPIFWVRVAWELQWQVMVPKWNAHCSLFPISHLCILTFIPWKLQVSYGRSAYQITALLLKTFLVWFRVAWEIWSERYGPKHISVILWYNIVCVYCKPIYTSLIGLQLHLTPNLTYLVTAYCTLNDGFNANDASFLWEES